MFRRFVESGVRFVRRTIRDGLFAAPHSNSSVQNAVVPIVRQGQLQTVNFKTFFFARWLQNASKTARFKFNPLQRMVAANRRNPTPLFLAFVGFTYMGVSEDASTSQSCSDEEQQTHRWLQNILQDKAENIPEKSVSYTGVKLKDFKIGERLGKSSCNSAVYAAEMNGNQCALKLLFNLHTNSQSLSLRKAFSKELVVLSESKDNQNIRDSSRYIKLPPHFNVIKILGHFNDDIPKLPDAIDNYPAVLPERINPQGCGRNRTMLHILPKFSGTLQDYIEKNMGNLSSKTSLALLTQLLEGLSHLNKNKVAHRDLKSDNILVNDSEDEMPHLVITDFGDCLAEKEIGLQMPYETEEICKGGNAQLMAPEVIYAQCGRGRKIDYSKSDEWAAASMAYVMFGQQHPFQNQNLNKETYEVSDLPELKRAPKAVQILVKQLLQRHPNDRPDATLAATACHMLLWAPHLVENKQTGLLYQVKRWFEKKIWNLILEIWKYEIKQDIPVEKQVLLSFLCRTNVDEIMEAVNWLRNFGI